jgi:hypothetical protein
VAERRILYFFCLVRDKMIFISDNGASQGYKVPPYWV